MAGYVMALDAGTTSCRAMVFDANQRIISCAQAEFTQIYPSAGYVEHDATEIYAVQYGALTEALAKAKIQPSELAGIGITNQRETTVVWDKATGEPVYNAIVWQCRRTAPLCERLIADGMGDYVREATGLIVDAYFSATKLKWILDNVPGVRARAERGELLFGTVDCWLVWKLTGGRAHVTDYTNAARTMMFNINTLEWDDKILDYLKIPKAMLPRVRFSDEIYGSVNLGGCEVPVAGMAGDQQAALFGQRCFEKGDAKNTYGTGCFMLCNTGEKPCRSKNRLLCTIGIAAQGKISYALEGSVFTAGALIQWLRDGLGIIERSCDSEKLALGCDDSGGVYVVPAFTGLGAPHWDMYARGAIFGLTRGSGRAQIARAALEAIAFQTADVLNAMRADTGIRLSRLRVDGGASANDLLLQIQADLAELTVERPDNIESTALGAAYLCGLATGFWSMEQISSAMMGQKRFRPQIDEFHRKLMFSGWRKAVERSKNWEAN